MKKSLIVAASSLACSIGFAVADPYPYEADPIPGGGACALASGCLQAHGITYVDYDCQRCCDANCPAGLNNCYNACWNSFCRYTNPPPASGCPVV